jgi:SNF2 family DNA or RNA helicase
MHRHPSQMAKMLDVLEAFLNLHGHTYMRLDGSTKPEARQVRYMTLYYI